MSVKPILFSGPMVKAIMAGRKTQTRRALKPQPVDTFCHATDGRLWQRFGVHGATSVPVETRFAPGDLLYVRETWKPHSLYDHIPPRAMPQVNVFYEADGKYSPSGSRARPGIHMPRWASRITLVVEGVRVERLQEISEDDAAAEGWPPEEERAKTGVAQIRDAYPIGWYAWLWDSINGAGSYAANPFVVAITFRPIFANVDAVLADPAAYGVREAA